MLYGKHKEDDGDWQKSEVKAEIKKRFPDKTVTRRNTGYAIDSLIDTEVFSDSNTKLNLSQKFL